jgi:hypothetical protein
MQSQREPSQSLSDTAPRAEQRQKVKRRRREVRVEHGNKLMLGYASVAVCLALYHLSTSALLGPYESLVLVVVLAAYPMVVLSSLKSVHISQRVRLVLVLSFSIFFQEQISGSVRAALPR